MGEGITNLIRWPLAVIFVIGCNCGVSGVAHALGQLRYQNPFDRTIGLRGAAAVDLYASQRAFFVEAGGRFLYGLPDLATTQARVGIRHGPVGTLISTVALASPVGREYKIALEPYLAVGSLLLSVALAYETLTLHGFDTAALATVGLGSRVQVSNSIRVGYSMDAYRLGGEPHPGANANVYGIVSGRISTLARVGVTRNGTVEMSIASWLSVGAFALAAGYDEAPGMLKGALRLTAKRVTLALGVSLHPFLGVSKSVFVTWGR